MVLKRQGRIEDRVFAETRLRRGVYGQRYDNGHRNDGLKIQDLDYPAGALTKGPDTAWDAPGMQRIKIPWGGLNAEQIEVLAELAEEYSDGISHITTRQDIQLHFIHIADTPDLMRRLAAVGITSREACGNSVRNVTTCPVAGVCHSQAFDVTPYAHALGPLPARPSRRAALRAQVQGRLLRLPARGVRAGAHARPGRRGGDPRGGRQDDARLRGVRWRRARLGAAPSQAVRRLPGSGGVAADLAGYLARVRAPGRKTQPRRRARQVPGRQARP